MSISAALADLAQAAWALPRDQYYEAAIAIDR